MRLRIALLLSVLAFLGCFPFAELSAETINITAHPTIYKSRLFFSPKNYTVTADSEFDASLFLDTSGSSVNTLDIEISFPANLVSVVRPSSGESIIGLWVVPPTYSNSRGTISFSGVILGGTKTDSGLVEKFTFRAKGPGAGTVTVRKTSRVLVNDGFGTETQVEVVPLNIRIESKVPDGVQVISNTHPNQGEWSNNKDPVFSWERRDGDEGYSYALDDKPFTSPDSTIDSNDTQTGYENVKDGIWYFHIKAKTGKLWSVPTNYAIRVDTMPPAQFKPTVDLLTGSEKSPGIVSFFSTDALSGIARYEVGVLDSSAQAQTLPGFIESESPFYLPKQNSEDTLVTVRAIDQAGNVRDETINVHTAPSLFPLIKNNFVRVLVGVCLAIVGLIIGIFIASRRRRANRRFMAEHAQANSLVNYPRQINYAPPEALPRVKTAEIIAQASPAAYLEPAIGQTDQVELEQPQGDVGLFGRPPTLIH